MQRRSNRTILLIISILLMLACMPTLGSAPAPLPTLDPNAPLTAIVLTAGAAATQTAVNSPPTATPTTPTNTPFPTATPTATFLFILPTSIIPPTQIPLGVSSKQFDCQILSIEPKVTLPVSTKFTAKWVIANIGKSTWDGGSTDYRYIDGEKLHLQSIYDFPATITPGTTVELTVDMQTPSSPGMYPTFWQINVGKNGFCRMELTVTVN